MSLLHSAITKSLSFLALSFLLFSCTTYTTKSITAPLFTKDTTSIISGLQSIVPCERVIITATQTTTNNNVVTAQLTVSFVNAKNSNKKLDETAKTIAVQLKQNLQAPDDFNSYKVIFVKKKGLGSFSEEYTYRKSDL